MPDLKLPPRWTQTTTQKALSADFLALCGETIDLTVVNVEEVRFKGDRYEYRLAINFAEVAKPFIPCVTQAIKLALVLGEDYTKWRGEVMRLVLDKTVTFGKDKVGGVRVTHLSSIKVPYHGFYCPAGGKRVGFRFDPLQVKAEGNELAVVSALFAEAETEEAFGRALEAGKKLSKEQKVKLTDAHAAAEKRVMQEGRPCVKGGQLVTATWCAQMCPERDGCPNGPKTNTEGENA
jgi:hypothetical protein